MTDIKIDGKVLADVAAALAPHADHMFKQRAGRWMAVVEIAHAERTEPGPEEDRDPSVKIRVVGIEVAGDEFTDERLRQVQQDMYRQRTNAGTLDSLMPGATRIGSLFNDAA
ncbi:hypothetical protein [Kitasatospora sp. CB01950]|uniref:hypothetical protein n=1 Tax=Kitasatospora sp. CB01950 TaxID=1703930 RepID=UPI00093A7666|nr:hypothetical protein [Kitasatospora sp. CB01950]OKJ06805.1 hypothetical protein AMK19_23405 [Kitasatospora sp. CB01950]